MPSYGILTFAPDDDENSAVQGHGTGIFTHVSHEVSAMIREAFSLIVHVCPLRRLACTLAARAAFAVAAASRFRRSVVAVAILRPHLRPRLRRRRECRPLRKRGRRPRRQRDRAIRRGCGDARTCSPRLRLLRLPPTRSPRLRSRPRSGQLLRRIPAPMPARPGLCSFARRCVVRRWDRWAAR